MRFPRIAAGIALAFASTGTLAVSGERWYGTNRGTQAPDPIIVTQVPQTEYVYTYPQRDVVPRSAPWGPVVERRIEPATPIIVERTYDVRPREYVVYRTYDPVAALNPETGPYIGQGLFPEPGEGPNDFGS